MWLRQLTVKIRDVDHRLIQVFHRYGHFLHRVSLGALFIWFGLLKPFGHKTTTSLLAHTVYWGDPEIMVPLLGWWEVGIGLFLIYRPFVRIALFLLAIRLPGTLLAFILLPEVCFLPVPFVPTPEGQYLIKDMVMLFAAMAIGGSVREESTPYLYH
ncbi:hypothetical protein C2W62_18605 [Candidatus Entotheonella serta]|nr:hypothetical protein C2W62_18605 [Candidatus Entotheonella serta]